MPLADMGVNIVEKGLILRPGHGGNAHGSGKECGEIIIRPQGSAVEEISILDVVGLAVGGAVDPVGDFTGLGQGNGIVVSQGVGADAPRVTACVVFIMTVIRSFKKVGRRRLQAMVR